MPESELLRMTYLNTVCQALTSYLAGGEELHIHSENSDGSALRLTFTINRPDLFHQLMESNTPPPDRTRPPD